ncbi:MAG: oligosaccharide flippase family protein [Planctomycetota bacterium]
MSTLESTGKRISRNAMFGLAAQVTYMIMRFIQTPWTLHAAGLEAYGFWSLLFVLLSYFGVNRSGISTAYQTEVARNHVKGDWARSNRVLGAGTTGLVILSIPACFTAWAISDPLLAMLKSSPEIWGDAKFSLILTVGVTWLSMIFASFESVLEGLQRHDVIRVVDFIFNVLETILIFVFLSMRMGLAGLALAFALRSVLSIIVLAILCIRYAPDYHFKFCYPYREDIRELVSFGGMVQGMSCLFMVICSIDRFVLASVSNLTSTGLYELARKLISFSATLPSQVSAPMIPAAADLAARSTDGESFIEPFIQKSNRLVAFVLAPILIFLTVLAQPILVGWLGHGEELTARMMWALAIGAYIHLLTGGITSTLRGLGKIRPEISYAVLWLILALLFMPAFGWMMGPLGVAIGSSAAQIGACALLLYASANELKFDLKLWFRNAFAPALALIPIALIALAGWLILKLPESRLNAALFLSAAGCFFAVGSGFVYWYVLFSHEEREITKHFVMRIRSMFTGSSKSLSQVATV